MEDIGDTILEVVIAVIVSTLAAGVAVVVGVIASMFFGGLLLRLGLMTDEGAAWSGISLGIPVGLVCAVVSFVYCFRKIRAYGQSKLS